MSDRTGQFLGSYRLIRLLGQGGFSDVYLGEHIHLNTYAAIKILRTELVEDSVENFRTEARTVAHLKHPNIVQVLDFGVDGTMPFLVMEYAPNGTLRQRHPRGTPIPVDVVVPYVKQVASALQYAHNQKLIHRDIKPENMLVGSSNEILLSDFGIAIITQSMRAQNPAAAGSWDPAGTVSYMAPEQVQGRTVPASDQYGLAIVVYEWLTGVLPFNGSYMEVVSQQISMTPQPLRKKVPAIPPEVEQVILTALNKDPQHRFGRIEAFAVALEQAARADPTVSSRSANSSEVSTMEASLIGPFGRTVLGSTRVTIGRAADNTLVISDPKASFHHAEIRPEGQSYSIVDLSSSNGTFVNEQPVYRGTSRLLQSGNTVRIGDTRFVFEASPFQTGAPASDGSTVRANPSSPSDVIANFGGNTSYGGSGTNYASIPSEYQATLAAQQPPYTPLPYTMADQQPPYAPSQLPYMAETQMPTYTPPSYGQPAQQPSYTPPPPYVPPGQPVQPQPQPPIPPPKPTSLARTLILAVVALVIILGGVGAFFVIHNNQVAQQHFEATATAQTAHNNATATALAQQNATATAVANVNLTATAIATSHYPPFTSVALNDSLTGSSSDWNSGSSCQSSSTGYQVSVAQVNTIQYCLKSGQFGEMAYQVTMSITQGDCGGLDFRFANAQNFNVFEVCQNGTYNVGQYLNGKWNFLYPNNHSSSAIKQGLNQQNVIAITVQGDTVNMYVNGKNIDTATNPDLTGNTFGQGQVGLVADDEGDPTTVMYTNALVWTTSS